MKGCPLLPFIVLINQVLYQKGKKKREFLLGIFCRHYILFPLGKKCAVLYIRNGKNAWFSDDETRRKIRLFIFFFVPWL